MASLAAFVRNHPSLFVLTGAGCSTASGIPDYRDAAGQWKRRQPVRHQEFVASEAVRRRYWGRSLLGWPILGDASPNAAHRALARLEEAGHIHHLLTQNVDGLHQKAGSRRVTELHGSIAEVICLDCGAVSPRRDLQERLAQGNGWLLEQAAHSPQAPDGDADIETDFSAVAVPDCLACGGVLKPHVVFFGDVVPKHQVEAAMADLAAADGMLVAGSSLMVYSGYRFCLKAAELGKPIAAVNLGQTRADSLLALKLAQACDTALPCLLDELELNLLTH
ncbi:MAG: NAD-dependent protein deacetylase [Rhodocyclaceae bacterium]|nr:MAG: NAD-dependent protein deacetylase [Rhodocyclaceae bacterium]